MPEDLQGNLESIPKTILVARNPKDHNTSFYHFHKKAHQTWSGDQFLDMRFNQFLQHAIAGDLIYGNWVDWHHSWLELIKNYQQKYPNSESKFLIIWYEEIVNDFENTLVKIAKFMNMGDIDVNKDILDQLEIYKQVVNLENMQKQYNAKLFPRGDFVRKGKVGDHANFFDAESEKMLEEDLKRLDPEFYSQIKW